MQQVARVQTGRPFAIRDWFKSSTNVLAQRVTGYGTALEVLEVIAVKVNDAKENALAVISDAIVDFGCRVLQLPCNPIVARFEHMQLANILPLVTVTTMMGTLYVSFACIYIPAAGLSIVSVPSVLFHSVFVLTLSSYIQGVIVDPGRVPDEWAPRLDDAHDDNNYDGQTPLLPRRLLETYKDPVERKKSTGDYRFCGKEKIFKPDRAHFCSAMQRNVLRMDHFCPWLTNCVGFYNHKFFFLCLFYTSLACGGTSMHLVYAAHTWTFSGMHTFMMVEGSCISSLLWAVVSPFFFFHCWLMSRNMTTIEFCEKRGAGEVDPKSPENYPWDIGLIENIKCVMGAEWYMWWLPFGTPPGNGIDWETRLPREEAMAAIMAAAARANTEEKEETEQDKGISPPAQQVTVSQQNGRGRSHKQTSSSTAVGGLGMGSDADFLDSPSPSESAEPEVTRPQHPVQHPTRVIRIATTVDLRRHRGGDGRGAGGSVGSADVPDHIRSPPAPSSSSTSSAQARAQEHEGIANRTMLGTRDFRACSATTIQGAFGQLSELWTDTMQSIRSQWFLRRPQRESVGHLRPPSAATAVAEAAPEQAQPSSGGQQSIGQRRPAVYPPEEDAES